MVILWQRSNYCLYSPLHLRSWYWTTSGWNVTQDLFNAAYIRSLRSNSLYSLYNCYLTSAQSRDSSKTDEAPKCKNWDTKQNVKNKKTGCCLDIYCILLYCAISLSAATYPYYSRLIIMNKTMIRLLKAFFLSFIVIIHHLSFNMVSSCNQQ